MTQLIAAICDRGATVITVSDRMVSTVDLNLTFEPDTSKATAIGKAAVVLTSGTMHEPDLIVDAQQRARGKDQLREIAEELKQQYQTIRRDRIEEEILKPLAGIESFAEYHQKQRSLYEGLVVDLNERIENYDVGLTIVLAGVDSQGHVGLIENPGVFQSWD